jgi:hypothetical protein
VPKKLSPEEVLCPTTRSDILGVLGCSCCEYMHKTHSVILLPAHKVT